MHTSHLFSALAENPIIAAAKDELQLQTCLESKVTVIFVLYGNILTIGDTLQKIKNANKIAIVHVDLIDGLATREVSVDFLAENTCADGIISTKTALVKHAKSIGLIAIRRFFVFDSLALESLERQLSPFEIDMIEILPGCMPKIIQKIVMKTNIPIIVGGLISDKEDVQVALASGAAAVSSSNSYVISL